MEQAVLDEFLLQPHVGVLASLRQDGRPYTVPIWWLYDDGVFWLTGTTNRIWCKQLLLDARCSLCIEALAPVAGHVGIDGMAQACLLPEFDIWPISRRLAEKYVGQGDPTGAQSEAVEKFFANMRTEPRMLFRLVPDTTRAIDMRVYRGKRADREFQGRSR
ncbi:MAG: pyridoxamine 5'-phosphate oxidase family protein [Pseudomonadales bacterium]